MDAYRSSVLAEVKLMTQALQLVLLEFVSTMNGSGIECACDIVGVGVLELSKRITMQAVLSIFRYLKGAKRCARLKRHLPIRGRSKGTKICMFTLLAFG
ncbi:hypothetical protein RRG08_020535 [Elysia crispata]|uniref:Uncharacterized protein n=1 Tax=Elysia crispata TaxID=231223 RepID=A0AAE0Z805_9GAST|nr:hypothetical protein RRG08_020535 [Elysia crispata]